MDRRADDVARGFNDSLRDLDGNGDELFGGACLLGALQSDRLAEAPGVAITLWTLNNTTFALNMAMLAATLFGFSVAGVASGASPSWFRIAGPAGALLLLIAAANGVAIAAGGAVVALGLLGFLTWLLFVVTTALRMIRESAVTS